MSLRKRTRAAAIGTTGRPTFNARDALLTACPFRLITCSHTPFGLNGVRVRRPQGAERNSFMPQADCRNTQSPSTVPYAVGKNISVSFRCSA